MSGTTAADWGQVPQGVPANPTVEDIMRYLRTANNAAEVELVQAAIAQDMARRFFGQPPMATPQEIQQRHAEDVERTRRVTEQFPGGLPGLAAWRFADIFTPIPAISRLLGYNPDPEDEGNFFFDALAAGLTAIPPAVVAYRALRGARRPIEPIAAGSDQIPPMPSMGWPGQRAAIISNQTVDLPPMAFSGAFPRFDFSLAGTPTDLLTRSVIAGLRFPNPRTPEDVFATALAHRATINPHLPSGSPAQYAMPVVFRDALREALQSGDDFTRAVAPGVLSALTPYVRASALGPVEFGREPIRSAEGLARLLYQNIGQVMPTTGRRSVYGQLGHAPANRLALQHAYMLQPVRDAIMNSLGSLPNFAHHAQGQVPVSLRLNTRSGIPQESMAETVAHELSHAYSMIGLPKDYFRSLTQPEREAIIRASLSQTWTPVPLDGHFRLVTGPHGFHYPVAVDRALVRQIDDMATGVRTPRSDRYIMYYSSPDEIVARAFARQILTRDDPVVERMLLDALRHPQMRPFVRVVE